MANIGSASGEIIINTARAVANVRQLQDGLRNLDGTTMGAGGSAGMENFVGSVRRAGPEVQSLTDRIIANKDAIQQIGGTLTVVGAAIFGVFALSAKTMLDFDAQMDAVGATSGATEEQLAGLRTEALRLGADTSFSASEAAEGMEILLKAGGSLEDVMNGGTESVLNLAAATGTDVPLAAETAAAAVNTFGVTYEDAADIITQSSNAGALGVNDWALALKSAGPAFQAAGMSVDDLGIAMVMLSKNGIVGEVAATSLRNTVMALSDTTDDGTKALADMGIATYDAQNNFRGLDAITADLALTWNDLGQEQQFALAEMIAGKDGATAFMAIMNQQADAVERGTTAWEENGEALTNQGSAATQAEKRMDNLKGSLENLFGVIETIQIVFLTGLAPAMQSTVEAAASLLSMLLKLPSGVQSAIAVAVGLVGALSLLGGGFLLLLPRIAETKKALQTLGVAAKAGRALSMIANPLRLLPMLLSPLGAALAIGAVAVLAYQKNWFGFGDAVRSAIDRVQGAIQGIKKFASDFKSAWDGLTKRPETVRRIIDDFGNTVTEVHEKVDRLTGFFMALDQTLRALGGGDLWWAHALADAVSAMEPVVRSAISVFNHFRDALSSLFSGDWGGALSSLVAGLSDLGNIAETIGGWLSNLGQVGAAAFDALAERFTAFGDTFRKIGDLVETGAEAWSSLWQGLGDLLRGDFSAAWSHLGDAAMSALRNVGTGLMLLPTLAMDAFNAIDWSAVWSGVQDATSAIIGKLGDLAGALWTWVTGAIAGIDWSAVWDGVTDVTATVIGKLGDLATALADWISGAIPMSDSWTALWDGVSDVTSTIIGKLGDLATAITTWISGAIPSAESWTGLLDNAVDLVTSIPEKLGDLLTCVKNWITGGVPASEDWKGLITNAGDFCSDLHDKWGDLLAEMKAWITESVPGLEDWKGLLANAGDIVTGLSGKLGDLGAWAVKWVTDAAGKVDWTALVSKAGNIVNGLSGKLGDLGAWAVKWIRDAVPSGAEWRQLVSGASNVVTGLSSKLGDLAAWARKWVQDGIDAAVSVFGTMKDAIEGALPELDFSVLSGAFESITEAASGFAEAISSAVGKLGEWTDAAKAFIASGWNTGWGLWGGDEGSEPPISPEQMSEIAAAAEDAASRISTALDTIKGAFEDFDGAGLAESINTAITGGFGGLSGENLGSAVKAYIDRGLQAGSNLLTSGQWGITFARTVDTTFTTGFGGMAGASLGSAVKAYLDRALMVAQGLVTGGQWGITFARAVDTSIVTGFGGMSGANLGNAIKAYLDRGLQQSMVTLDQWTAEVARKLTTLQADVDRIMTAMEASMRESSSKAQRDVSRAFADAARDVSNSMRDIVSRVQGGMRDVESAGRSGGEGFASGLRGGASRAVGNMRSIVSEIASVARSLESAMYAAGSNAGNALARGLRSALGDVRAAASAIVREANRAAQAAAEINSPSRVWMWMAKMMGQGMAGELRNQIRPVADQARAIMDAANGAFAVDGLSSVLGFQAGLPIGATGAYVDNRTYTIGDIVQQPGEDGEALADRVIDRIENGWDSTPEVGR